MPSLEKPCLLLPHGCERSTVYVCVPVDVGLASRSPVIETLLEFEGLVELPEGVSLDDFEGWSAMVTREPSTLTLDELRLALQVGEKLSAHNTTKLAEAVSAKLKAMSWTLPENKESMLQTLLSLSKNMQQLVFRKLGTISASALFKWPMPLQQAYADRWVAPRRGSQVCSFKIVQGHTPTSVSSFLELLSRTDPSLPGLTSLSLECPIPTPEAASLLSSALLHHPAIAELDTPRLSWAPCGPYNSPPAAAVLRTLPQLTAITSLTLSAPSLPPSPPTPSAIEVASEAVHSMAAAISALPGLAEFRLYLASSDAYPISTPSRTAPPPKRRKIATYMGRGGSAATPPSLDPVVAALSTAPALAALAFTIQPFSRSTLHCSGIHGPFCTLRRLQFDVCHSTDAGAKAEAGRTDTPLTELLQVDPLPALNHMAFSDSSPCPGSAHLARFLAATVAFPTLRIIEISLGPGHQVRCDILYPKHDGNPIQFWHIHVLSSAPAPVREALSTGMAAFSCSQNVSITWHTAAIFNLLESGEGVAPLLRPLSAVTQLQRVSLMWEDGWCHPQEKQLCDSLYGVPLSGLTQVTELLISVPSAAALRADELAPHLGVLTQLRDLYLRGLEHSDPEDFRACLAPLTALQYLSLAVRPITAALISCFGSCAAAMPALLECHVEALDALDACRESASADWIKGLLDLPCRGYYEFCCSNSLTTDAEVEAVRRLLIARGAEVGEQLGNVDFKHTCMRNADAIVADAVNANADAGMGDADTAASATVTGAHTSDDAAAYAAEAGASASD